MLTEYNVLKPDIPRASAPGQETHEYWRQEQREKYPDWKPLGPEWNVRWVRPEHALHYIISIKAARPGPDQHLMWAVVGGLFQSGAWSFTIGTAMMALSGTIAGYLAYLKASSGLAAGLRPF